MRERRDGAITVLGSFVVDLMGRAGHLPAAGETVLGSAFKMGPGGKGSNQAVAAHRAGADTVFITKLGRDLFSSLARDFYDSEKMPVDFLFEHQSEPTGTALILVDQNTSQNSILVNPGACAHLSPDDIASASGRLKQSSILLTQLETNLDVIPAAVELFRDGGTDGCTPRAGKTAILNPAPAQAVNREFLSLFDIVTPNEVEASILSGIEVTDFESAERAADYFLAAGVNTVIITMGSMGCFIKCSGRSTGSAALTASVPAFAVDAVDTTGAGDAFNGALAAALSFGMELTVAVTYASAAAALSVTRIGTAPAMAYAAEIEELIGD